MKKTQDQPRGDIPRGHDTRDISGSFGPGANEATFPDAPGNEEGTPFGEPTSIPTDRRSNPNGSPRGRR